MARASRHRLSQHRPIDLLATPMGMETVNTFPERLEFGVHAYRRVR